MRNFINIITEASERITVRGQDITILTNPTKSVLRQFRQTQGQLRASVFWDGSLTVFPAMLATHGDIDDSDAQYPMMVLDDHTLQYHFDSDFPQESVEEFKEEIMERLPHHQGLVRAFGPDFHIEFDEESLQSDDEEY